MDCLQNFLLLFVPLLTAPIVTNSCIFAEIYFIFLKKCASSNQGFFASINKILFLEEDWALGQFLWSFEIFLGAS